MARYHHVTPIYSPLLPDLAILLRRAPMLSENRLCGVVATTVRTGPQISYSARRSGAMTPQNSRAREGPAAKAAFVVLVTHSAFNVVREVSRAPEFDVAGLAILLRLSRRARVAGFPGAEFELELWLGRRRHLSYR